MTQLKKTKNTAEQEVVAEATKASVPAPTQPLTPEHPMQEAWEYMGTDGTAVIEVAFSEPKIAKDTKKSLSDWLAQVKKPKVNKTKALQIGVNLAAEITAEANLMMNQTAKNFADRAIFIGRICLELKALLKGQETPWGVWADQNLPFIGKRNREKYMFLAKREDVHQFTFLGVDRLEILCSATKESSEEDPAGALLRKYNIAIEDSSEVNLAEFKAKIDAALNTEKLVKHGLTANPDVILSLTRAGVEFDKACMRKLKDIQECGGDSAQYLNRLAANGGKEAPDGDPEKRFRDFNTLSEKLIKTLDYIIRDSEQLEKLNVEAFEALLNKLIELKQVARLGEGEE